MRDVSPMYKKLGHFLYIQVWSLYTTFFVRQSKGDLMSHDFPVLWHLCVLDSVQWTHKIQAPPLHLSLVCQQDAKRCTPKLVILCATLCRFFKRRAKLDMHACIHKVGEDRKKSHSKCHSLTPATATIANSQARLAWYRHLVGKRHWLFLGKV